MAGYEDETASKSDSAFRNAFKLYRNISIDQAAELIDFDRPDDFSGIIQRRPILFDYSENGINASFENLYLRWPPNEWSVYEVSGKPGFLFLKNPFTAPNGHLYWAKRSLVDYARWPHATNVDSQLEREGIALKDLRILDDPKLLKKLRWATLGYQHDWDTKVYSEEKRSDVPDDLRHLSHVVAKVLFGSDMDFRAEAVIVNFYRMNSTLAGHVDHSEKNFGLPLFSFSFGQSAIFLLGGTTVDEKPIAVKIRSGDVVVMSGECRLAYHAVPRIFSDGSMFDASVDTDEPIVEYLSRNRINMNVRQVN